MLEYNITITIENDNKNKTNKQNTFIQSVQ